MKARERVLLCWSGGKDSALALHALRTGDEFEVAALLTTLTEGYDRISMHGVRRELLVRQAQVAGLDLAEVWIPKDATNEAYEARMRGMLEAHKARGVRKVVFGDIFLADLRQYRQQKLAQVGMTGLFPLWGQDTAEMARRFVRLGFQAILTCVDTQKLDGGFAGRAFDEGLLADLPDGIDPCGENGEFHTFVHAGPIFRRPVACRLGEVVLRENRFCFCDVAPG